MKIQTTYLMSMDELEDAVLHYLERDEEIQKELAECDSQIKFLTKAIGQDMNTGMPLVEIKGVQIIVEREEL